jgi:hypothetical protein
VAWRPGGPILSRRIPDLRAPIATDGSPNWGGAEECSLSVYRRFHVGRDTILATIGRAPEACSEAPRLMWRGRDGRVLRRILPPLFNWNIESLWCTSRYIVFGLRADDEGGSWKERLAFWNAQTGGITLSPAELGAYLPRRLPGWRQARVAEVGDAVVFVHGGTTIAYWPEQRRVWASP